MSNNSASKMLELYCSGTPYEVGMKHGVEAKDQVLGSIDFYRKLFQSTCAMDWSSVCNEANKYVATLEKICPRYLEEMRGIAEGSGVGLLDVVALNVRTEITFGLFTTDPTAPVQLDGCTSVSIKTTSGQSILAQNWDWQKEQASNLVVCHISQPESNIPRISIVTEAGVIGKIGCNERGVGVCLNAIRARGVDRSRLPVHLALRAALEATTRTTAVELLTKTGVAGSAHILIADETGGTGLECTMKGIRRLEMDDQGLVVHSNHLLLEHPGIDEPPWLQDSPGRLARLRDLVHKYLTERQVVKTGELFEMFKDETNHPASINRCQMAGCETQTLFNIIMELSEGRVTVTFGRPTEITERIYIVF